MDDHNIDALVLVDAAGIKPREGEIAEIFMVSADTRLKAAFPRPQPGGELRELHPRTVS